MMSCGSRRFEPGFHLLLLSVTTALYCFQNTYPAVVNLNMKRLKTLCGFRDCIIRHTLSTKDPRVEIPEAKSNTNSTLDPY